REGIGILHALNVAARAGIAIPVPGAADAAALLKDPCRHAEPVQPVQHVHAGKACADHDNVIARGLRGGWLGGHGRILPENCSDLPASILSAAAKRKTQTCRSGLRKWRSRVGQRAMLWPLGFLARDRLASDSANEKIKNEPPEGGRRERNTAMK